jgi:hypothetical protein
VYKIVENGLGPVGDRARSASLSILNVYRPQVEAYQHTVETESWKTDHQDAMVCRDIEQVLLVGIAIYDGLNRADEMLRIGAATGKAKYTKEIGAAFSALFDWWLSPCGRLELEIHKIQRKGFTVENAEPFLERCRRARSVKDDSGAEEA